MRKISEFLESLDIDSVWVPSAFDFLEFFGIYNVSGSLIKVLVEYIITRSGG